MYCVTDWAPPFTWIAALCTQLPSELNITGAVINKAAERTVAAEIDMVGINMTGTQHCKKFDLFLLSWLVKMFAKEGLAYG